MNVLKIHVLKYNYRVIKRYSVFQCANLDFSLFDGLDLFAEIKSASVEV